MQFGLLPRTHTPQAFILGDQAAHENAQAKPAGWWWLASQLYLCSDTLSAHVCRVCFGHALSLSQCHVDSPEGCPRAHTDTQTDRQTDRQGHCPQSWLHSKLQTDADRLVASIQCGQVKGWACVDSSHYLTCWLIVLMLKDFWLVHETVCD